MMRTVKQLTLLHEPDIEVFRVIACGSRGRTDWRRVWAKLDELHLAYGGGLRLVHGACPTGADHHAEQWFRHVSPICALRGLNSLQPRRYRYPADRTRYGRRRAGMVRNRGMAADGADLCLAFRLRWEESPGTDGMRRIAAVCGIPIGLELG